MGVASTFFCLVFLFFLQASSRYSKLGTFGEYGVTTGDAYGFFY